MLKFWPCGVRAIDAELHHITAMGQAAKNSSDEAWGDIIAKVQIGSALIFSSESKSYAPPTKRLPNLFSRPHVSVSQRTSHIASTSGK
jgi:hypothetical protein